MSAPKCLFFFRILTALTEVLGRDIRANGPRMSAGYPSQKLPLWADFSFLNFVMSFMIDSHGDLALPRKATADLNYSQASGLRGPFTLALGSGLVLLPFHILGAL